MVRIKFLVKFLFFLQKKQRINVMKQRNKGAKLNVPENKTESFFAGMDEDLKLKLYEYCARDYEMFYS